MSETHQGTKLHHQQVGGDLCALSQTLQQSRVLESAEEQEECEILAWLRFNTEFYIYCETQLSELYFLDASTFCLRLWKHSSALTLLEEAGLHKSYQVEFHETSIRMGPKRECARITFFETGQKGLAKEVLSPHNILGAYLKV